MNGRQAAKLAAQRISELEYVLARQVQDIKDYNACIADMISGESPCSWCEDLNECQLEAKMGKGCSEWWLKYRREGDVVNESKTVLPDGVECGTGAEADKGEDPAL